jgi:hypothetical protein
MPDDLGGTDKGRKWTTPTKGSHMEHSENKDNFSFTYISLST